MDGEIALGFALALAAACCYETGYALQAIEARRAPAEQALRPSLMTYLRPAAALGRRHRPLAARLAAADHRPRARARSRWSSRRWRSACCCCWSSASASSASTSGRREIAAVAADHRLGRASSPGRRRASRARWSAAPASSSPWRSWRWSTVLPYAIGLLAPRQYPMLLLVASAGAADGMAAFVAKIVAQDASDGRAARRRRAGRRWSPSVVIVGLISESTALQRFAATRVAPTVLVMQIVIPVVLAPLVGGESWSGTPLGGAVLAVALVAVAVGAGLLASSPAVAQLAVGEAEDG